MIKLTNINKSYGKKQVLKNINFPIKKGRPLAIVGHNGAGKSTIIKILLSIIKADNGEIKLANDIKKVGYLPEERGVYRNETVLTHLNYFAELSGVKLNKRSAEDYLAKFEILKYKNFKLKELSKGNAQKLQLALCFIGSPDLLILDEPFSGLDPLNRKLLSNIMKEDSADRYTVFSSHQMKEIEDYCSDILIISKGEIKYVGRIDDLKASYQSSKIVNITFKNQQQEIVHQKAVIEGDLNQWLMTNDFQQIVGLSYGLPDLEEIYLDIMRGNTSL